MKQDRVLAVVGARLNSSRLPAKQLLDLSGKPLIERVFERLERCESLSKIVLATTADAFNQKLVAWAEKGAKAVFAYPGDVNNLMDRVHQVVLAEQPAVVVYVCGDSPLIEPVTIDRLVHKLTQTSGDMATVSSLNGKNPIHEGFSVYSRDFWERLYRSSTGAHEKEHVGAAMAAMGGRYSPVYLQDQPIYYQIQHRLSVDTPSDYRFMQEVYRRWYGRSDQTSIVDLAWVINLLQEDPKLKNVNARVKQRAVGETAYRVLMATVAGPEWGLGHLSRALVAIKALQDQCAAGVFLLIEGTACENPELDLIPHQWIEPGQLPSALDESLQQDDFQVLIGDWPPARFDQPIEEVVRRWHQQLPVVSVDFAIPTEPLVEHQWIPSFYLSPEQRNAKVRYGWDAYLLRKPEFDTGTHPTTVLVLSGGSDALGLGATLPTLLDSTLPPGIRVIWVRGPFAEDPQLNKPSRLDWQVEKVPWPLTALLAQSHFAVAVYGVSLFECILHRLPCVTLLPQELRSSPETNAFKAAGVARLAHSEDEAVNALCHLIEDSEAAGELRARQEILSQDGPTHFARAVQGLIDEFQA